MSANDPKAIKRRISSAVQIPVARLEDDALISDLVAESFAALEMVIDIQEEFQIRFAQEDFMAIRTIGSLTTFIEERAKHVA